MTEDEAKTKWCPFARARGLGTEATINRPFGGEPEGSIADDECLCIGSACMAWRWKFGGPSDPPHGGDPGHCGLAGSPQ